jgi:NAD(P)-dependent dehydrogenase (short-subunit alcohol dehydrogenase family)
MKKPASKVRGRPAAPVALVTGASQRIGREIALALARDGFDVAVHFAASRAGARETVAQIRKLKRRACAIGCNLAAEPAVRAMLQQCAEQLGEVSCLVNNASLFEADTADDFQATRLVRHMRVNVAAPIVLARELHARLPEGAQGVVINLLDQKLWNPNPDFLSYTLSKAALMSATDLLARALAPKLRVVGIAPGITLPAAGQSPDNFERASRLTPLGRSSTPLDVGQAVAYLARAPAVTGTTLLVDGGQHLIPTERDVMFLHAQGS